MAVANKWENPPRIGGDFPQLFICQQEKRGFLRLSPFGTLPAK
jgi:hypothetical protein